MEARSKHTVRGSAALALALFASACGSTEAEPDLDDLVERVVTAQGGTEALARLESVFRQRSDRLFTLRRRPTFHLVVVLDESGGVRYAEGFDGEVAWEMLDGLHKVRAGARAQTALWHTTQFPGELQPLSHMPRLGHALRRIGLDTADGTAYHRLLLTLSDGFEREYFVNAATYRIERARDVRRHHASDDEAQPIEGLWSDFREVEGVWMPFRSGERNYETGERLSEGTLRQVRINVPVPDEVFRIEGSLQPFLDYVEEVTGRPGPARGPGARSGSTGQ